MNGFEDGGWILFLFVSGGVFVYMAWRIKRGYAKNQFLKQRSLNVPKDIHYGYGPLGLGLILVALAMIFTDDSGGSTPEAQFWNTMFQVGFYGGFGLSVLFMLFKPNFVKPRWLLWLEANYDWVTIEYMFTRARRDSKGWERQIATQEGLERWAGRMAQQYEAQSVAGRETRAQ